MVDAKNQSVAKPRARTAKKAASASAAETTAARAPAKTSAEAPAETTAETTATTTAATPADVAAEAPGKTTAQAPAEPTAKTTEAKAAKPAQATKPAQAAKSTDSTDSSGNRISVTIPLDSAVVGVALKAATLPVTAAKKVAQNRNGIPAYIAVGGLAVIGAVEWPIAAVGGLSLAALRRWGPLKPAEESKKSA